MRYLNLLISVLLFSYVALAKQKPSPIESVFGDSEGNSQRSSSNGLRSIKVFSSGQKSESSGTTYRSTRTFSSKPKKKNTVTAKKVVTSGLRKSSANTYRGKSMEKKEWIVEGNVWKVGNAENTFF